MRRVSACLPSFHRLRTYFVDLRVTLVLMCLWLACVLTVFIDMNISEVSVAPSLAPSLAHPLAPHKL